MKSVVCCRQSWLRLEVLSKTEQKNSLHCSVVEYTILLTEYFIHSLSHTQTHTDSCMSSLKKNHLFISLFQTECAKLFKSVLTRGKYRIWEHQCITWFIAVTLNKNLSSSHHKRAYIFFNTCACGSGVLMPTGWTHNITKQNFSRKKVGQKEIRLNQNDWKPTITEIATQFVGCLTFFFCWITTMDCTIH